jgi:hypothetical protein
MSMEAGSINLSNNEKEGEEAFDDPICPRAAFWKKLSPNNL